MPPRRECSKCGNRQRDKDDYLCTKCRYDFESQMWERSNSIVRPQITISFGGFYYAR
jgi:hypothetical protein